MRILIVAATAMELAPLAATLDPVPPTGRGARLPRYTHAWHDIDMLITGVGMVATAAWCSRALADTRYDLALNVGVCGSFDPGLAPGTAVHVVSDRIAELGAEDDDRFLTIQDLNLVGEDVFVNAEPPRNTALSLLPAVSGITVNTVHGNEKSIAAVVHRFKPQVESMEGAGFMCACLLDGLPFAQVRAVSNVVEKRNRDAWKVTDAIASLGRAARDILETAWS